VAFATCSELRDGSPDDHAAGALLDADYPVWDDPSVDWDAYDRVILRSVWDYTLRVHEFLDWCRRIGSERLRNGVEIAEFNADKRYLSDLSCPTVPTLFVAPGERPPDWDREMVVKPSVSAGARNTGRFAPEFAPDAQALLERIHASGRTALVQPYLRSVDELGETALVFIAGQLSHELHKRPVLAPDEVAPTTEDRLAVAKAMLEADLVVARAAREDERALARAIVAEISGRFGTPLYARVDLVRDDEGRPVLLELELIEPRLYFAEAGGAAERFAAAVLAS
jgi:predicted metal-dependent HD superfamily phosphohydrolase